MRPLLLLALALAGCIEEPAMAPLPVSVLRDPGPAPDTLPAPPFALEKKEPANWDKWDPTLLPEKTLQSAAHAYANEKRWGAAQMVQYAWLQKPDRTEGRYNMACYSSMAGDLDAAIYWLQEAVPTEGVDSAWAARDPELTALHADPRWADLAKFLASAERYWQAHGVPVVKAFAPTDYVAGTPVGTLVLLHGIGSEPANIFGVMTPALFKKPMPVVSVSGTMPKGPKSYRWSEDPDKDEERIQAGLKEAAGTVVSAPGKSALVGFSQGGIVALNQLSDHPENYTGAIAFSPLGNSLGVFDKSSKDLTGKHVIVMVGAGEDAAALKVAERAADVFKRRGADVVYRVAALQTDHSLPMDFTSRFPEWATFALGGPRPPDPGDPVKSTDAAP